MAELKRKKIVKISREEILESDNVLKTITKKLIDAGIPVSGGALGSVSSGTLKSQEDIEKDIYIYTWEA